MINKTPSKIFAQHLFWTFFLISCFGASQFACSLNLEQSRENRNKAETELDNICKNIKIPDDFIQVNTNKSLDISKVAIFKGYKTNSSCKDIGEHFQKYFIENKWDTNQMNSEQSHGGMATVDFNFRNNGYVVSVECESSASENSEKKVVLSCSWGLKK